MYATPSQFAQEFGLADAAQLLRDEADELLTPDLLGEGLAADYGADRTADEIKVCEDAMARLAAMVVEVTNYMDGCRAACC